MNIFPFARRNEPTPPPGSPPAAPAPTPAAKTYVGVEFCNGRRRVSMALGSVVEVRRNLLTERITAWWSLVEPAGDVVSVNTAHILTVDVVPWDDAQHKTGWIK